MAANNAQKIFANLLVFFYVPVICWFGHTVDFLIFERIYYAVLIVATAALLIASNSRMVLPQPIILFLVWLTWAILGSFFAVEQQAVLSKVFAVLSRLILSLAVVNLVLFMA